MSIPRLPVPTQLLAALLVLMLCLQPFGRGAEYPMALLSLFGVIALWRRPAFHALPSWGYLGLLYALFVLPMFLALPDAVAQDKSLLNSAGSLRFVLSGCALLWLLQHARDPHREQAAVLNAVGLAAAVLLSLWCLDALLQFLTGSNILGYGAGVGFVGGLKVEDAYINGMFGDDDNLKFGITTALFLPVGLVYVARKRSLPLLGVFTLLALTLILLSGKRGAWIAAAVEVAILLLYYVARGRLFLRHLVLVTAAVALALVLALGSSDWVRERTGVLLDAVQQPDYTTLNRATGKRLPIWRTAWIMGQANWLNGVGPRGFRYAYPDYAASGDAWADPAGLAGGSRASHAHQLLLDLWSETGVIGLLSYVAFLGVLWRSWRGASVAARSRALPFGVSLLGMLFPINTHAAFYSSWSGLLMWFFVGLYLYAIAEPGQRQVVS